MACTHACKGCTKTSAPRSSLPSLPSPALVSRQYVDMSRIRIEGLLAAFPKLVGSGGKQHTYVETESVRYVYQPMEVRARASAGTRARLPLPCLPPSCALATSSSSSS